MNKKMWKQKLENLKKIRHASVYSIKANEDKIEELDLYIPILEEKVKNA
jgi:hypothetical protein